MTARNISILSRRGLLRFVGGGALVVLGMMALGFLSPGGPVAGAAPPRDNARAQDARTPYGEMNLAWTEPGMIGLVGWTKDPDVNRPIDVVVAIDNGGGMYVRTAGVYNPFLPGRYAEKFRSYLIAIPTAPGPHTMCVAALNVGRGNPFRLLGCASFNVATADPIGNFDGLSLNDNGDSVAVSGWAFDAESAASLAVDITLDGAGAARLTASTSRPDVGAVFSAAGPNRGFSGSVAVSPGIHQVCAVARNLGRGADAVLGCRVLDVPRHNPLGNLESATATGAGLVVTGWAGDPDASGSIGVRISDEVLGAIDDAKVVVATASSSRSDVAAIAGLDARAGYSATLPIIVPGEHRVCATALNVGKGRDQPLGCRQVTVRDLRPTGNIEFTAPLTSGVRIGGWVIDGTGGPVNVRVAVDGAVTSVTTDQPRPDVAAAYPGSSSAAGFDTTISGLSPGRHTVCVTLVGTMSSPGAVTGDRVLPCGAVIVGPTAVGTTGIAGLPVPVGPTGPLSDVDRDAGVTTRLRDGSVLWLFGDSVGLNPDGSMRYFVSGTGAWASAANPTVTRDAVGPSNTPFLLATPGVSFPACSPSMTHQAMWPLSAVTVPAGDQDRVVVFLANMCLADGTHFEAKGYAIAEWYYDPANPPAERPVQLTVINPNVGLMRAYGTASVLGADGYLYLHQCDRPANPLEVDRFGPCRVARVLPGAVADPGQYRYWNGGSWVANDPGVSMDMPSSWPFAGYRYPASAFTVAYDEAHGVYVMVYSPWPGFIDRAVVRVSRSPQGPWSEPVEVTFPGCNNVVGAQTKSCYAGTAQPAFSTTSELGLGYYDQAIPADRNRGQYQVVRVPFVVSVS